MNEREKKKTFNFKHLVCQVVFFRAKNLGAIQILRIQFGVGVGRSLSMITIDYCA
jgi:hypothetical protein